MELNPEEMKREAQHITLTEPLLAAGIPAFMRHPSIVPLRRLLHEPVYQAEELGIEQERLATTLAMIKPEDTHLLSPMHVYHLGLLEQLSPWAISTERLGQLACTFQDSEHSMILEFLLLQLLGTGEDAWLLVDEELRVSYGRERWLRQQWGEAFQETMPTTRLHLSVKAVVRQYLPALPIEERVTTEELVALNATEREIIGLVRNPEFYQLRIMKRQGKPAIAEADMKVSVESTLKEVLGDSPYQTIQISKHAGKCTDITRTLRKKF